MLVSVWNLALTALWCVLTAVAVDRTRGPDLLIVTIALESLTVLVMPCYGEDSTWISEHVRISQTHKLIAAFVLGKLTPRKNSNNTCNILNQSKPINHKSHPHCGRYTLYVEIWKISKQVNALIYDNIVQCVSFIMCNMDYSSHWCDTHVVSTQSSHFHIKCLWLLCNLKLFPQRQRVDDSSTWWIFTSTMAALCQYIDGKKFHWCDNDATSPMTMVLSCLNIS